MIRLLLWFGLASTCFSQAVELPASLNTNKGKVYTNAKITAVSDTGIKIMHDGGLATLPFSDLPSHILSLLKVESPPPEEPAIILPQPFTTPKAAYKEAELTAVEPDGIRIRHSLGAAKVPFEDLPESVVKSVGPFDALLAAGFREAEAERNRAAYTSAQSAIAAIQKAEGESLAQSAAAAGENRAALLADPGLVSPVVSVRITASSSGGKSRGTSFQTSYGSYERTETSVRNMRCTVASRAGYDQRVRLQCLFLTRDVTGLGMVNYEIVADNLVSLAPQVSKTIEASAVAQNSDDNYVVIGLRIKEGVKYIGWIWRAIDGLGRVSAVYSSLPSYDRHGWSIPLK